MPVLRCVMGNGSKHQGGIEMRVRSKGAAVGLVALVIAVISALACVALVGCVSMEARSNWGESAEFVRLMTGQERFSTHGTNIPAWFVIVDHQTGAQYLFSNSGRTACPLLDVDGTPLLVSEAGE